MDWNLLNIWNKIASFLKETAATLPAKPCAIIMVSAYGIESNIAITEDVTPKLIYDYYGLSKRTYSLEYPAQGRHLLAQKVASVLPLSAECC